jgi:hypothetical protein
LLFSNNGSLLEQRKNSACFHFTIFQLLSIFQATNIQEAEEKKPKVEEKVEVALVDTTEEHRAHLFDLNCKICTGKMAPPGEVVAKSPTMSNVT